MLDLIECIMGFIYRHQLIRRITWQLIITFTSIFLFLTFLFWINLEKMGYASFDFELLLNLQAYVFLINEYAREIAYFLIVEQALFILALWYMNNKLKNPLEDDKIIHIDIKDLSKIWLEYENTAMIDTSKNAIEKASIIMVNKQVRDSIISLANLRQDVSQIFLNDIIKPNLEKIHPKHLEMIIKLLQLLEENIACPSVVQLFEGDPNTAYGKAPAKRKDGERVDTVTLDGKTRFDVYEKISLLRHSLHVAYKIIELLNESKEYKSFKKTLFGKAIIVALGHDIGKINNFTLRESYIKEQRLQGNAKQAFMALKKMQEHQKISYIIFYELFKNYPDLKELATTVQNHHLGSIDKEDKLLKLLVDADKQTREYELDAYLQNTEEFEKIRDKELSNNISTTMQTKLENITKQPINNKYKEQNNNETNMSDIQELVSNFILNFNENKKKYFLFTTDKNTQEIQKLIFNFSFKNTEKEIYTDKKSLFVLVECGVAGNKTDIMNYFYDLNEEIINKLNKKIKIGFAMFRDCKDINEAIEGSAKALNYVKNNEQIVYYDYKDYKQANKSKIEISDIFDAEIKNNNSLILENKQTINDNSDTKINISTIEEAFKKVEDKVKSIEYSLPNEENFDIPLIEVKFLEILKSKINTLKNKGFSKKIQSISFRKFILFSRECLLESLAEALNTKVKDLDPKLNFLIRYYRNHHIEDKRLIWFVNVDKNFYHSTYLVNTEEFLCIPFDGPRAFGMSATDLENHKKISTLSNYNVKPYIRS